MKFFNTKNGRIVKTVLAVVLAIATVAGAAALIATVANKKDDGLKKISPTFEVGGLTESGKYKETKLSLYTNESFGCQGLKITPDFDAGVCYQVYYYGDQDEFISSSEVYTEGIVALVPDNAIKARLVITPIWEAGTEEKDKELNIFDALTYGGKLTVEVAKEQFDTVRDKRNSSLPNEVFELVRYIDDSFVLRGEGHMDYEDGVFIPSEGTGYYFSEEVSVVGKTDVILKVASSSLVVESSESTGLAFIFDGQPNYSLEYELICVNGEFSYISIDVTSYSSFALKFDTSSYGVVQLFVLGE